MSDTEYISKDAFVAQQRKQYCVNCERRKGKKNSKIIFVYDIGEGPCRACDIGDMIDEVWDFSPADVTPVVHGHWIECDYKYLENGFIETDVNAGLYCSNCRTAFQKKNMTYKLHCPVCGAKMDEREGNKE